MSAHSRFLTLYFSETKTPLIKIISLFDIPPGRKRDMLLIELQHAKDHKQILISEMLKREEREKRGREDGGWAEWLKETGRYRLPVTECVSHENKRHSVRNTVSDTVTVM